jgi:HAD superfamily hydrolase (TIGR01490 family)
LKKRIAFFDFDGTITSKDTLLEIIKFRFGNKRFLWGFLLNGGWMLAFKAGIISNQTAKEKILKYFFGKTAVSDFQQTCDAFAMEKLPDLLRPKALLEIKKLQEKNATVVIVSASPENWIQRWCTNNKLELIATKLQTNNQQVTGKIDGRNCYGTEKTVRIKQVYELNNYDEIYCYGDTNADKPMLELADIRFFKPFC